MIKPKIANAKETNLVDRCDEETFCPEVELSSNENGNDKGNANGDILAHQKTQAITQTALRQLDSTFYMKPLYTRKRSVPIENENKVQPLSIHLPCNGSSIDVYEFNEENTEEGPKKKQRQIKQPKKRTKPTPWPRVKTPQIVRNEKMYTIGSQQNYQKH